MLIHEKRAMSQLEFQALSASVRKRVPVIRWLSCIGNEKATEEAIRHCGLQGYDNSGISLLHMLAFNGDAAAIRYLAETVGKQQSPFLVDIITLDEEDSPLGIAAVWGHIDAVKELLRLGASPRHQNADGETPLQKAEEKLKYASDPAEKARYHTVVCYLDNYEGLTWLADQFKMQKASVTEVVNDEEEDDDDWGEGSISSHQELHPNDVIAQIVNEGILAMYTGADMLEICCASTGLLLRSGVFILYLDGRPMGYGKAEFELAKTFRLIWSGHPWGGFSGHVTEQNRHRIQVRYQIAGRIGCGELLWKIAQKHGILPWSERPSQVLTDGENLLL